jgi:hypothetical protein
LFLSLEKECFHEVIHRKFLLETSSVLRCTTFLYRRLATVYFYPPAGIYGFGSSSAAWSRSRREKVVFLLKSFSAININKQCGFVKDWLRLEG